MAGLRRLKPDIPGLLPVFVLVIGLLLVSPALSIPPTAVMEATTNPFAVADDQATGLLDLQHHYQLMNRDLAKQAAGFGDEPTAHEAIQIARLALQQRETLLQGFDLDTSFFAQQHRNLDIADELLAIMDTEHGNDLHQLVALAQHATFWQAATIGFEWSEPIPPPQIEQPSQALLELATRHDVTPTPKQKEQILSFDGQPEPLRSALTRFLNAFLAFDTAARIAYANADTEVLLEHLQRLPAKINLDLDDHPDWLTRSGLPVHPDLDTVGSVPIAQHLLEAGVDLMPLLPTRNQVLDAILDLDEALRTVGVSQSDDCNPVQVPTVFSIDLTHCDNHYTSNYALMLDAGGNDQYHNNAGGNGLHPATQCTVLLQAAAALVDLGPGDDEHGDPENPRECGANGGGAVGAGFLFNAEGGNTYTAGRLGTNGGGTSFGSGFLLDGAGNDRYEATLAGTNGGGVSYGMGMLIDGGGDDVFAAEEWGTNGGGAGFAAGFLLNRGGDNSYKATFEGTNGGGGAFAIGFLLDRMGNDTYTAKHLGTNGGGALGTGFLFDGEGDDTFTGTERGTNGEGSGGIGLLIDGGGMDYYEDWMVECWDCSVAPKGILGFQIDSDESPP